VFHADELDGPARAEQLERATEQRGVVATDDCCVVWYDISIPRHFQRIKNEVVGPECEAVELYPAESRLVDTATQFHLWVISDPNYRWPIGYNEGRVISGRSGGGAVQRPFEEEGA
jgi:hypothetical protein